MSSYQNVVDFLVEDFGLDETIMTPNTDVQTDLNIYGDDAAELIILLRDRFKVDFSSFEIDQYFKGEGFSFKEFLGLRPKAVYRKLLIKDLVRAVEVGYLV